MGDVHTLPGVFRADLEPGTAPEDVLKSALDANLREVAVVGWHTDGSLTVWGSHADADISIALLMRGLTWLATGEQAALPPEDEAT